MIHLEIRDNVPKYLADYARKVVDALKRYSPVIGDLKVVVFAAYEYPSSIHDFWHAEFCVPSPGTAHPTVYIGALSAGSRNEKLAELKDRIVHEMMHYYQYRDKRGIEDDKQHEAAIKKALKELEI